MDLDLRDGANSVFGHLLHSVRRLFGMGGGGRPGDLRKAVGCAGPVRRSAGNTEETMPSRNGRTSAPLVGLFLLAIFYTLYAARLLLLPIVLALVLFLLLQPVVRLLRRAWIPPSIGALLVVAVLVSTVFVAVGSLYEPAVDWMGRAPGILRTIELKLHPFRESLEDAKRTARELEEVASAEGGEVPKVKVQGSSIVERALGGMRITLAAATVMVILLYFLLAYGDVFLGKLIGLVTRPAAEGEILQ
jgi:predicted PurR-regulated permease PerM